MYSTYEVAEQGEEIGDASSYIFALFVITLITYLIDWVLLLIFGCFSKSGVFPLLVLINQILTHLSFIALMIAYCICINQYMKVDPTKIAYFAENKCSDSVLQYSLEKFNDDYSYNLKLLGLGLAFTLLCFVS